MANDIVTDLTRPLRAEHREELEILDNLQQEHKALDVEEMSAPRLHRRLEAVKTHQRTLERHFRKEEVCLFPLLKLHLGTAGDPIGQMEAQHGQILEGFALFLEAVGAAEAAKRETLHEAALCGRGFITLLRKHAQNEDEILFHLAELHLGEAEKRVVIERMPRFEDEEGTPPAEREPA